jgi:outer membrane autotransporter protein
MDIIDVYRLFGRCVSMKSAARPAGLAFLWVLFGVLQAVHGGPTPTVQYWDNTATNGTWNTSPWSATVAGGGSPIGWTNGNNATFSTDNAAHAGNYNVLLTSNVTVQDFTFRNGSSGSTLSIIAVAAPTITMQGAQMNVAIGAGTTMLIDPTIAGGRLIQNGPGTLILTGTNTYTEGTTVNGGTLSVGSDSKLGIGGGLALNGGTLVTSSNSFSTERTVTLGLGTNTVTGPDLLNFREATFMGLVTGAGGLTVGDAINGARFTLMLTDAGNDYMGGTRVVGGATVELDTTTDTALGSGGITLEGGILRTTPDGFSTTRSINLVSSADPSTLHVQSNTTATYLSLITGSGGLTIGGNGTVVLANAGNSYTGGTTIVSTVLSVSANGDLGNVSGGITLKGGKLLATVDGFTTARPILLQSGEGNDALAATEGKTAIYTGPIFDSTSVSGNGSFSGVSLSIGFQTRASLNESGTVVLTNHTNSYSGGTIITAGATLSVDSDTELGNPSAKLTLRGGKLLTTADGFRSARAVQLSKGFDSLAAANGTTATYTGIFSGSDNDTLEVGDDLHTGTVVLTGNNIYTGGTEIQPLGTLVAGSNNALGAGEVALFRGTLIILAGVTLDNPVNISGGGTVNNAGTLNNSITDAFSGPQIVINSGTINGNVLLGGQKDVVQLFTGSKITGNVVLNGIQKEQPNSTLILDGAGQQLFSLAVLGSVTNNGNLVKQGTGTWTIDRALDAPGGTEILSGILAVNVVLSTPTVNIAQGGALQLNNGGDVGSFIDNGSLIFARSDTFTFARSIAGTGNVIQNGPGTTILSGANTYSGGTVVELGTLVVDSPQALGTGNVTVNGGILATDPQPINVKGNYTQNAGGTLQLNVAGGDSGQYDTLNVGGSATLGGTLKLISLGFLPKAGDQLTLVTTAGSVSGRFDHFIDPFGPSSQFTFAGLVYEPNAVLLEFRTAASLALTPNQLAAANLLDAVHLEPSAANLMSFLSAQPFANLPNAFQQISPEALTAFYEISFSNANIQRLNLEGRLDDLHNGSTGFSSNMKVNGATVNVEPPAGADGKSAKSVVEPILQPAPQNRWGVWVTGFGDFVNVDGDGNAQGYNFTTGGVSIGIDYRITDQLAIGVMGDYSHTWTSLQNGGNIDVNSGRGGLYATWYNHGIYLDAAIYAGHNSYNSSRSGLDGLADGNTGGTEWSTFLSGGYDFHFGPLTVGPIGALQYTYANVSGFSENGSLAPMQIESNSVDSLRSDVGFRLFYQWQIGKVLLEPSLKAAWEHEFLYSALPITAGFAGIPGPSATFSGPSEGHDSAIVSAGVSAQWTPALTVYVNYDGQLGRWNYDSNAVTGGVRISF